jgi:hypothetical protein
MIRATVKTVGALVNRPRISFIDVEDESHIAIRRKNEDTNKVEQFTISELFDVYSKNSSYEQRMGDNENPITTDLWETWFMNKYIRGTGIETRLISISYERI